MNHAASPLRNPLDLTTLTLADTQARERGLSVTEHLRRLVEEAARPNPLARGMAEVQASLTPPPSFGAWFNPETALYSRPVNDPIRGNATSPALRQIADFTVRVDLAATLLSAAFQEGGITDFAPPKYRAAKQANWYGDMVEQTLHRVRQVRAALLHPWQPNVAAERLVQQAFGVLADLTPSGEDLLRISQYDRPKAFADMARQLDVRALQIEHAATLIAGAHGPTEPAKDDQAEVKAALLEKAGGGLSLTEAAALLGVSRQAVHKRVKAGTVLAMMDGPALILPRDQFTPAGIVAGIAAVVARFKVAGAWSALQFLVEPDPSLGGIPLDALKDGRTDDVVHAAEAYLDIEG